MNVLIVVGSLPLVVTAKYQPSKNTMRRRKLMLKNFLATIWLIVGSILWISLSAMSPQMGLEEIGELSEGE